MAKNKRKQQLITRCEESKKCRDTAIKQARTDTQMRQSGEVFNILSMHCSICGVADRYDYRC